MSAWLQALPALHLLRPQALWLLAAVPLAVLVWALRRRGAQVWQRNVDAHLLPHLLVPGGSRDWPGLLAIVLGLTLAVLALAGPSWRQQPVPMYRANLPLVVALDLSSSSNAGDLPPSRLLQARAKLAALLRQRNGGDVALLAFAGDSFTVAPLTADAANVGLFLDALAPEVMPVDGKRADRAIASAAGLMKQAGYHQGQILLLTDQADAVADQAAREAAAQGYAVSVLGLGTPTGAPYRNARGDVAQARLDEAGLRALATAGGGRYARLGSDDADLQALGVLDPGREASAGARQDKQTAWQDQGYWLLPPLMLLALLAFRRRGAVAMLALGLCLPLAMPARAAGTGAGTWWQRADQLRQQRIAEGVQAYRAGDYASAQKAFQGLDGDQAQYNLGNALARQGHYDEAIAAYDRALKVHPGMADAVANRAAVEAARRRQQDKQDKQGRPDQRGSGGQSGQPGSGNGRQRQQGQQGQQGQRDATQPGQSGQSGQSSDPARAGQPPAPPQAENAEAQRQADQAQQQRMQQAMAQQGGARQAGDRPAAEAGESAEQRERRQAVDAWMRRVPDDPGALLRSKFRLEYERRQREGQ